MARDEQTYKLQIVSPKRQMTVPEPMMEALRLKPGDFIEFTVSDHCIVSARPSKTLPIDTLPDHVLDMIQRSRQEYTEGKVRLFDQFGTFESELEQARVKSMADKGS